MTSPQSPSRVHLSSVAREYDPTKAVRLLRRGLGLE